MASVQGMDFDKWQAAWLARAASQGHTLKTYEDDDRIDLFAGSSSGIHNGPLCTACGWSACMHCEADYDAIPTCSATADARNTDTGDK